MLYEFYFIYDKADKISCNQYLITKGDILDLSSFVGPGIWETWDKMAMGRYSLDLGNVNQSWTIVSAQCCTTFLGLSTFRHECNLCVVCGYCPTCQACTAFECTCFFILQGCRCRGLLVWQNLSCCYYVGSILMGGRSARKTKVPKRNCCCSSSSRYLRTAPV